MEVLKKGFKFIVLFIILSVLGFLSMAFWLVVYRTLISSSVKNQYLASLLGSVLAVVYGILLYLVIYYVAKKTKVALPSIGSIKPVKQIALGLLIAFLAHLLVSILMYNPRKADESVSFTEISKKLLQEQGKYAWGAAITEELTFRVGVAHFLNFYYGEIVAIIGNNISFSLAHFKSVSFDSGLDKTFYFISIACIGVLVSIVYFRYGLLAAMAFHWTWNTVESVNETIFNYSAVESYRFPVAWKWIVVTLVFSLILYFYPCFTKKKQNKEGIESNRPSDQNKA